MIPGETPSAGGPALGAAATGQSTSREDTALGLTGKEPRS